MLQVFILKSNTSLIACCKSISHFKLFIIFADMKCWDLSSSWLILSSLSFHIQQVSEQVFPTVCRSLSSSILTTKILWFLLSPLHLGQINYTLIFRPKLLNEHLIDILEIIIFHKQLCHILQKKNSSLQKNCLSCFILQKKLNR